MPSTRNQKAKEKRSRQSDVMSDLENMDVMLGIYSRNDLYSQRETEGDSESTGLQTVSPAREDFRSLKNTNSRENSEITNETATQVTRILDEIREDLNSQIVEVINSALAEKVLPSIQNVLGAQESELHSARDHRSGRLDRSPEDHLSSKDLRSGRLDCNPSGHSGRTDHRSKRQNIGPVGNFGQKESS